MGCDRRRRSGAPRAPAGSEQRAAWAGLRGTLVHRSWSARRPIQRETSGLRDHLPGLLSPTGSLRNLSRSLQHSAAGAGFCPGASVGCSSVGGGSGRGCREHCEGLGTPPEAAGGWSSAGLLWPSQGKRNGCSWVSGLVSVGNLGNLGKLREQPERAESKVLGGRWDPVGRNLGLLSSPERKNKKQRRTLGPSSVTNSLGGLQQPVTRSGP